MSGSLWKKRPYYENIFGYYGKNNGKETEDF